MSAAVQTPKFLDDETIVKKTKSFVSEIFVSATRIGAYGPTLPELASNGGRYLLYMILFVSITLCAMCIAAATRPSTLLYFESYLSAFIMSNGIMFFFLGLYYRVQALENRHKWLGIYMILVGFILFVMSAVISDFVFTKKTPTATTSLVFILPASLLALISGMIVMDLVSWGAQKEQDMKAKSRSGQVIS